ncbi:MAG: MBOAT family protein [Atopobiaceae bacterium]|nr:MBOAT family protein [Atopobiaceae bacterium]
MVFSSIVFLCAFLPVTLVLYWLLPGIAAKNALLIVASLVFYAYGEPLLVLLLIASTLANWLFGLLVDLAKRAPEQRVSGRGSRLWLTIAIIVNLAFLGVFKYASMVVTTFNSVSGLSLYDPHLPLPLGISFYTFQALSYVIDVYRAEAEVQCSYPRVLLYISLFPQLVAGPIVKYREIDQQLGERTLSLSQSARGMRRFVCGLAKKVLIANVMASTVDMLWGLGPSALDARGAWLAAFAYLLQIYFDFSGYSDMAIGLGALFGFEFEENFDHPYTSTSIKEFWRRWHISLSTWFRDYLYIPLGGNQSSALRTGVNKAIVFFLCGLWHGASWNFAIWGLIHGAFSLIEEVLPVKRLPKAIGWLYTIVVVLLAFVVFRADNLRDALLMWKSMFGFGSWSASAGMYVINQLTPLFVATLLAGIVGSGPWFTNALKRLESTSASGVVQTLSLAASFIVLVVCVAALASGGYNPFIYFRF